VRGAHLSSVAKSSQRRCRVSAARSGCPMLQRSERVSDQRGEGELGGTEER
jgi:hypothetical protein